MKRAALIFFGSIVLVGCVSANRPLQLISGAGPVYPASARTQNIEGEVVVRYDVSSVGQVENAEIVSSDPVGVFDDAALQAVRSWLFNAPLVDGESRAAQNIESTVVFQLSGAQKYDAY